MIVVNENIVSNKAKKQLDQETYQHSNMIEQQLNDQRWELEST
jgi:hypothetical protein